MKRGFTLLEVLIATTVLVGGMMMLSMAWSGNNLRLRKSNMYYSVATLLERKMVEIEALYKDKPLNEIPEEKSGDFGADYKDFRWELKSRELKFPDLAPLIVGGGNADDNLITMIRQITDVLSKSVKEIKVSVFVKTPKKEAEFSATTYMLDYNQGLSAIPGAGGADAGAAPAGGKK